MNIARKAAVGTLLLILLASTNAFANTKTKKRDGGPLKRAEHKEAQSRLSEMGYGKGQQALSTFQKWEGRKITGRLTRAEFEAIRNATPPRPKDAGYKHVEVDLDRQVLLLTDDDGRGGPTRRRSGYVEPQLDAACPGDERT